MSQIIFPAPLKSGDRITIIAPATKVKKEYVDGAAAALREEGFEVKVSPFATGFESGSFTSTLERRLSDLRGAIADPSVRAIFCARGGYGCQQLLPYLKIEDVRRNPKWIVGFSDISALHALWLTSGVASIHGPMGKHFTLRPDNYTRALIKILKGEGEEEIIVKSHPLNRPGEGTGRLFGGNLAVLNGLAATPFDILSPAFAETGILFIEDIGENIYEIDRILTRLAMAGTLNKISGLLVGEFTDYHEDLNYRDMEEMISRRLDDLRAVYGFDFPMIFNIPLGHGEENHPFVEGGMVKIISSKDGDSQIIPL